MYSDSVRSKSGFFQWEIGLLAWALMCILLWRFVGESWVIVPSLIAILIAGLIRSTKRSRPQTHLILLASAAFIAPIIAFPGLWPCPLACQGLGAYSYLWGFPTWAWGMVSYVLSCGIGMIAKRYEQRPIGPYLFRFFQLSLCAVAGASIWFIYLSWQLHTVCNHCLAIHTLVLTAACLGCSISLRSVSSVVIGLLASHAAFSIDEPVNAPITIPTTATTDKAHHQRQIDRLAQAMILGDTQAAYQADLILDPLCPHCRSAWQEIAQKLGTAVGAGKLSIRLRLRYNHRLESSRFAAEMLIASGATGNLTGAIPQLIGLSQMDSEKRLRHRWATNSFFRPDNADTIRDLLPRAITGLLQQDMAWMNEQQLLRLTTPILILKTPQGAREIYSENLPLTDISLLLNE